MIESYSDFLAAKALADVPTGIEDPQGLPACLSDFQSDIVPWALRRGRAALFAGTGLGKTLMELAWADAVARHANRPVLALTPLAVAAQHIREADKFGLPARRASSQADVNAAAVFVTNYEKLDRFDLTAFAGLVLDESSILKAFNGKTRNALISAARGVPFRLAASATPAPNDFMELGNHAEFLGVMSYAEMLATFFVHDGGDTQKWRLKRHAEEDFWRWVASWAVMLNKPSDLGYPDGAYVLPPLNVVQHIVDVDEGPCFETGLLLPMEARTMQQRLAARRATVRQRVELAASLVRAAHDADRQAACGSRNTPSGEGNDINPILPSGSAERPSPEAVKRTPHTCATITSETPTRASGARSSSGSSTSGDANDTPVIRNMPTSSARRPEAGIPNAAAKPGCSNPSASISPDTSECLPSKAADARSADRPTATSEAIGSPSTIVMPADGCAASFAETATTPSASSATISSCSNAPSPISAKLRPWVIWCNLNDEQDALERAFGDLAISIRGSQAEHVKERLHEAWLRGERPILISKPSVFGFGMNWQHCRDTAFVGLNDSFEQLYQAIRRFWRFGQTETVNAHLIAASTEGAVVANLKRKEADAQHMMNAMVRAMADFSAVKARAVTRDIAPYRPRTVALPSFLDPVQSVEPVETSKEAA